jgi:hypothetical protein
VGSFQRTLPAAAPEFRNDPHHSGLIHSFRECFLIDFPAFPCILTDWNDAESEETPLAVTTVRNLRAVPYSEVVALVRYLDGHTPFTTKHNVEGDEFENVLVVLGRGWNRYNFDQLLQRMAQPGSVTPDKWSAFERNRNLFYISCSRSMTNLALLFTQLLSAASLSLLTSWFGQQHVIDVGARGFTVLSAK